MIDLERKAIAYILMNPQAYLIHEFNSKWFVDKNYREVANAIESLDGRFDDFSVIVSEIKKERPFTKITSDWLEEEHYNAHAVGSYKQLTQDLKRTYHQRLVTAASELYIKVPSESNRKELDKAMQQMNDMDLGQDEGDLYEAHNDILWQMDNDREDVIKTFNNVDKKLGGGAEPSRMIVIGARPGTGKTAYAVNMAELGQKRNENNYVSIFSLEMIKELMMKRFISYLGQISIGKMKDMKNLLSGQERVDVVKYNKYLTAESNIKIYDQLFSIDAIVRAIHKRNAVVGDGSHMVIIDYLQLIESEGTFQSRQVEIGKITKKLKRVANELKITIILLSQLSRASEDKEKPTMRDLRESGDIEQDADIVMLMHQDKDDENHIFVEVDKNRDGGSGTLEYTFLKSKMTFVELD